MAEFRALLDEFTAHTDIADSQELRGLALGATGHRHDDPLEAIQAIELVTYGPRPGDLLVRRFPAEGVEYVGVIVGDYVGTADAFADRGIPVESAGPGLFVEVAEVPFGGGGFDFSARKIIDPRGGHPRGQQIYRPRAGSAGVDDDGDGLFESEELARHAAYGSTTMAPTSDRDTPPTTLTSAQLRQAWAPYECADARMTPYQFFGEWDTRVNPETVEAWFEFERALLAVGFRPCRARGYDCRQLPGQRTRSLHAYGLAVDLDPAEPTDKVIRSTADGRAVLFSAGDAEDDRRHDVRRGMADTSLTREQVEAVEAIQTVDGRQVFAWGGRWRTTKATMHFQINVTPTDLARGIRPGREPDGPHPAAPGSVGIPRPDHVEATYESLAEDDDYTISAGRYTAAALEFDTPRQGQPAPQCPLSVPTKVHTAFRPDAVAAIPTFLEPKPLARLEVTLPTKQLFWMIWMARKAPAPHWSKNLALTDDELLQLIPSLNVSVDLFQTVPVTPQGAPVRIAFERYAQLAAYSPLYLFAFGSLSAKTTLEARLCISLDDLLIRAGLPTTISSKTTVPDTRAGHVFVIYASTPPGLVRLLQDPLHRVIDEFEFDKSELTDNHKDILKSIEQYISDSWHTPHKVKVVHIEGHTDHVGTREYNVTLGRQRAEAAQAFVKERLLGRGVVDPTKIGWEVVSRGKEEPVGKIDRLNRRCEISLIIVEDPPKSPVRIEDVVDRLLRLLPTQRVLAPDVAGRMQCVLGKLRTAGTDDRYANFGTLFYRLFRDRVYPGPGTWPTFRFQLVNPDRFGKQVTDADILKNLGAIDDDLMEGVVEMNRLINYYQGVQTVGSQNTVNSPISEAAILGAPFKWWNEEFFRRMRDPAKKSVYACYKSRWEP